MDNMNEGEIGKILEEFLKMYPEFKEANDRQLSDIKKHIEMSKKLGLADENLFKKVKELATAQENYSRIYRKSSADLQRDISRLSSEFKNGTISAAELSSDLESLRRAVNRTSNASDKKALNDQKISLEEANVRNKSSELLQSLGGIVGIVGIGLSKAFKDLTIQALSSGSALQMTASLYKASFDIGNSAAQYGAKNLTDFGKATAGAGGAIGKFGVIATGIGQVGGQLYQVFTDLAKAGIDFMVKSAQTFTSDFQAMSAAGASFAGGMEEMIHASTSAGLTTTQFSKVMNESKDSLLAAGFTVGEGSKKLATGMQAATTKIGLSGRSLSSEMAALGISYEDQGVIMAQFMAQQKLAGKNIATMLPADMAEGTRKYAENLKVISDITGKDAKKLATKAQADTMRLQMMGKLTNSGEQKAFQDSNMLMDKFGEKADSMRIALMQMVDGGVVTNPEIAASPEMMGVLQSMKDGINSGNKNMPMVMATAMEREKKNLDSNGVSGAIQRGSLYGDGKSSVVTGLASTNASLNAAGMSMTPASVAASQAAAKTQGEDKKSTAADLQDSEQKMAMMTQKIAEKHLPALATAVKDSTEKMRKYLEMGINASASSIEMPIWFAPLLGAIVSVGTTIATAMIGRRLSGGVSGKMGGGNLPGTGGIAGAGATGVAGKVGGGLSALGNGIGSIGKGAGAAISGILTGTASGLKALASPKVLLGIGALTLLAIPMAVISQVFKTFSELSWESVAKGLTAVLGVGALGALAGAAAGFIIPGAIALGILAVSIGLLGAALKGFPTGALDPFFEMFDGMGTAISDMFGGMWKSFTGFFSNIGTTLSNLYSDVKKTFSNVIDSVVTPFKTAFDWIKGGIGDVKSKISGVFDWISSTASKVGAAISTPFATAFDWVSEKLSNFGAMFKSVLASVVDLVPNFVKNMFGDSKSTVEKNVAAKTDKTTDKTQDKTKTSDIAGIPSALDFANYITASTNLTSAASIFNTASLSMVDTASTLKGISSNWEKSKSPNPSVVLTKKQPDKIGGINDFASDMATARLKQDTLSVDLTNSMQQFVDKMSNNLATEPIQQKNIPVESSTLMELKKMNALLLSQNDILTESAGSHKQLVGLADSHKNLTRDLLRVST